MIQETFVDNVGQDQTAQNVQSDLLSTLPKFCLPTPNSQVGSIQDVSAGFSGFNLQL